MPAKRKKFAVPPSPTNGAAAKHGLAAEAREAGDEEIKSRVVDVSPEKAAKWLERNHEQNRSINYSRVDALAGDMRDGNWKVTHQGVAFDGDGKLIDGQHRLTAVINSGVTVRMMVTWNVGAFGDPIDCGRPRSLATLAQTSGKNVALVNGLRQLEQGYKDNRPMTLADFHEVSQHHAGAIERVRLIAQSSRSTAGILAGLTYAMPLAEDAVVEFGTMVVSGERLVKGEPGYALWMWKSANRQVSVWDAMMACMNAVRSHLSGSRELRSIFTTESGYRAITTKRRVMKIPHTPASDVVVPGITLIQKRGPRNSVPTPPAAPRQVVVFEESE